jgi:pyridoxal phosphate enzyme (YggS family)
VVDHAPAGNVAERLFRVLEAIESAAERAGRAGAVQLVAVSKTVPVDSIAQAYTAGQRVFGENRVQEGMDKISALRETAPDLRWHLIGHLQTNKAKAAAESFDVIESVDSFRLAERLDERAGLAGRRLPVLFEVNVAGEASKSGFSPGELTGLWPVLFDLPHLDPRGLMTVAPLASDPETVRPVFRRLRELRDEIRVASGKSGFSELSMGMSGDFATAIEEGATIVRLGRAIFGERRV